MPRPSSTLHLGDLAPDFELPVAGSPETRSLEQLLAHQRALLLVHRGMW